MDFTDELRNQINANISEENLKAEIEKRVEILYDYYMVQAIHKITKEIKDQIRLEVGRMTSFNRKEINGRFQFKDSILIPYDDYDTEGKAIQEILKNRKIDVKNANINGVIIDIPYPTVQIEKSKYSLFDLSYNNKYTVSFCGHSKRFFEILEANLQKEGISMGKIYCTIDYYYSNAFSVYPGYHPSINSQTIEFFTYRLPTSSEWMIVQEKKHILPVRMHFDYSIKL